MCIEATQRHLDGDHRHARQDDACRKIELAAKDVVLGVSNRRHWPIVKLVLQATCSAVHLVANSQQVAQRGIAVVARAGRILHCLRLAQEILGVLHYDGAQAWPRHSCRSG